MAFSRILADELGTTAAGFLVEAASFFAAHGVRIQRVLTDNAKAYTLSRGFQETAASLGISLRRTRVRSPQTMRVDWGGRRPAQRWVTIPGAFGRFPQTLPEAGALPVGCPSKAAGSGGIA